MPMPSIPNNPLKPALVSKPKLALLSIVILVALCCLSNNGADPDLWGHVQFGRDVLRDGIVHATTTYSFTANGYLWINHENLSELVLALTYDNLGIGGLILGKLLLALGLLTIIVRCGWKNGAGCLALGIVLFFVASRLSVHWHFRPQIASFVCFGLMLWLLEYCFAGWTEELKHAVGESESETARHRRLRWLWLMPVLLFVWANSHGGFVAGVCVYVAYLGGRSLEAIYFKKKNAWGLVRRFALMATVGVFATLVNPYGPNLHLWLLQSLGEPRPEIRDWHSIDLLSAHGTQFLFIVGLSVVSFVASKRKLDFTKIAILAIVCWQAYSHIRHVAFFVLLVGFWVPAYLEGLFVQLRKKLNGSGAAPRDKIKKSNGLLMPVYGLVIATLIGVCVFRSTDLPVDKSEFPVEAFKYMADNDVSGRLVVTYNWAQYAIGAFGGEHSSLPICPVAFDGRFRTCYPQQVVDMHFDFVIGDQGPGSRSRSEVSGPLDNTKVLSFGQPELVLISRRQKPSVAVMKTQTKDWCLLYQDSLAQLWGRKSVFNDRNKKRFLAVKNRKITDEFQSGSQSWPAIPRPRINPLPNDSKSRIVAN